MNTPITLAVTAYKESDRGNYGWIKECIAPAVRSEMVREIVVVNDGTPDFSELEANLRDIPKVRCVQNPENLGVFGNKVQSVIHSTSEWTLMCDSDNIMGDAFYAALQAIPEWNPHTLYSATFARPNFDYRQLNGTWNLGTISKYVNKPLFCCAINTGNQLVHRESFLEAMEPFGVYRFDLKLPDYFGVGDRSDVRWRLIYDAADSFFINKVWMEAGRSIEFVPGLEYDHRHHASSWARAPEEKEVLTPIFILEMMDKIHGVKRTYRYIERRGGAYRFSYDGGTVSLNLDTMILGS